MQNSVMGMHRDRLSQLTPETRELLEKGRVKEQDYLPQQFTDETVEEMELANLREETENNPEVFDVGRREPQGGLTTTHSFAKERKYQEAGDFVERARTQAAKAREIGKVGRKDKQLGVDMNVGRLIRRRLHSHIRAIEAIKLKRDANLKFGGKKGLMAVLTGSRGLARESIAEVDNDFAKWFDSGAGRVKPRNEFLAGLAWWNRKMFKPWVTIGFGPIPNPAFVVRNSLSGVWMAASDERIGAVSGIKHLRDMLTAMVRRVPGLGRVMPETQMNRLIAGRADPGKMMKGLEDLGISEQGFYDMAEELGVMSDDFVTEDIIFEKIRYIANGHPEAKWWTGKWRKLLTSHEIPAMLNVAAENRMRMNGFAAALKNGLDPAEAASATRDVFIDYAIVSSAHRALRDVVPFAQFTIGQTPQTLRMLTRNPRATVVPRAFLGGGSEGMVPPYISGQPHTGLGEDAEGNPQYMTGFGTPWEDANFLWQGSGKMTMGRAMARTHPLLKTLVEIGSGRDLHFGTERGTYRRDTPTMRGLPDLVTGRRRWEGKDGSPRSEVSPHAHQVLAMTPASRLAGLLNTFLDERKDPAWRALAGLTGIRVSSVDEARELRRRLSDQLKEYVRTGEVGELERYYARGELPPGIQAVLDAYAEASK